MTQPILNGASRPENSLNSFNWPGQRSPSGSLRSELLLLFVAGAFATVLHQSFRWPLQLPGHHGIEWLAILMLARLSSQRAGAGLVTGIGAASAAWLYAGSLGIDGKSAQMLTYVLQGALIDALMFRPRSFLFVALRVPLAGAAVHMVAPLVKNLFHSLGSGLLHFGSLLGGIGYPLLTHAVFGALGAACGLIFYLQQKKRREKN